jgi:Spy/CpxP family protein refolding chaperone
MITYSKASLQAEETLLFVKIFQALIMGMTLTMLWSWPVQAAPAAGKTPGSPASPSPTASPSPQGGQPDGLIALAQRLDLNEQQVGQIKIVMLGVRTTAESCGMRYNAEAQALHDALTKQAPIEEIRSHMESMAKANIDVDIANIEAARAIEKILTPEQLKKWRDLQQGARPAAKP